MEVFLGKKKSCRRKEVLDHFGEVLANPPKKCCDNCTASFLRTPCTEIEWDEEISFYAKYLTEFS